MKAILAFVLIFSIGLSLSVGNVRSQSTTESPETSTRPRAQIDVTTVYLYDMENITLPEQNPRQGLKVAILVETNGVPECGSLNSTWFNKASSLEVMADKDKENWTTGCLKVFDQENCEGETKKFTITNNRIKRHRYPIPTLGSWDNRIKSLKFYHTCQN
jgi:hypothetical protein